MASKFDYQGAFADAVEQVKAEGPISRVRRPQASCAASFPRRLWTGPDGRAERDVVVWCSNDYLGQGQNPVVLERHARGHRRGGLGLRRHAQHLRHQPSTTSSWRPNWPICTARKRRCCSPRATSPTRRRWQPSRSSAGPDHLLRRAQSCLDDRRHPPWRLGHAGFRHNDLEHLEELLAAAPADAPKLSAFESVYSMDGDIADIAATADAGQAVRRHDLSRRGPCGGHVRHSRRRGVRAGRRRMHRSTSSRARSARRSG